MLGDDAHLGQHRGDHLAALTRVRRGRQLQAEFERRRDAGFLEQRAGFVGVVGVDSGQVDIAWRAGHVEAADRFAKAFGHTVDDLLAVDGASDRSAHPHVV